MTIIIDCAVSVYMTAVKPPTINKTKCKWINQVILMEYPIKFDTAMSDSLLYTLSTVQCYYFKTKCFISFSEYRFGRIKLCRFHFNCVFTACQSVQMKSLGFNCLATCQSQDSINFHHM